jgi:hypothetical protein
MDGRWKPGGEDAAGRRVEVSNCDNLVACLLKAELDSSNSGEQTSDAHPPSAVFVVEDPTGHIVPVRCRSRGMPACLYTGGAGKSPASESCGSPFRAPDAS